MKNEFLKELEARGFIHQVSNLDGLEEALDSGKIVAYLGSDPTADSLHVGHLVPIMMMRWLQKYGHKPIMLVGGATARIGDPSGRDNGRPMMSDEIIEKNSFGLKKSFSKFIKFGDAENDAIMVDNYDWMKTYSHMEFLREYGTDFTVPRMLSMESVKRRLETGMTFLEFNYMTFQAVDYLNLYKKHNCILQTCGADQWGNSVMGIELIRKKLGREVFVLSTSLITDSNGVKIGKSAGNAVWVNEDKTSPYEYYQYFRNTPDDMVEKFLKIFTEIPLDEIAKLSALKDAELNSAKKILAFAATEIAHGTEAAQQAENEIPVIEINKENEDGIKLCNLISMVYNMSKSEARRNIEQGGISFNHTETNPENNINEGVKSDPNEIIPLGEYIFQKGKKKIYYKVIIK